MLQVFQKKYKVKYDLSVVVLEGNPLMIGLKME